MLKRCSDKKDMTEWNQWRKGNPDEDIELEGADFSRWQLEGVHLNAGKGKYPYALLNTGTIPPDGVGPVHMLQGNVFLKGAKFIDAHLEWADFRGAYLNYADFSKAHLNHAQFQCSHLEDTEFFEAEIEKSKFALSIVNGSTILWNCMVNRDSDFRGVALDNCRIEPGTRQLLEYNIRRMNWEQWYEKGCWLKRFLKKLFIKHFFWSLSDYGRSTGRIILWFFGLAFVFALIYRLIPTCVSVEGFPGDIRGFWHVFYFSVVTMTTLGFGDIAANPDSWLGQTLLMIQVILGYVLLGALITRFAVLFTAGGPAGRFADEKTILDRLRQLWTKLKGRNAKRK